MELYKNFEGKIPMIDVNDAVMVLIDHQSGLFQCVHDMPFERLRDHAIALAQAATLVDMPVVITASVPQGPNGPLIPEIEQVAPHAVYIPRRGEINSWDCPDFVKAIEATGRKTLIIVGTVTSVCLAFPAISAVNEGYRVFVVPDASGTYSKMAEEVSLARMVQAGCVPIDTLAVVAELQKTWRRSDVEKWLPIWPRILTNYGLLIESFARAKTAIENHEIPDNERE